MAERRDALRASLLSFIAAFVDTCGFVGLYGLFTSHVTGNFVMIGAEAVQHHAELVSKVLAMPVFLIAVLATARTVAYLRSTRRQPLAPMLCIQAALLSLAFAATLVLPVPQGPDSATTLIAGMLAVAAMGVQNALMRLELAALPATTVMTLTVTQTTIDALALASKGYRASLTSEQTLQARRRFERMWPTIGAFIAGAACGAAGYTWIGFWSLLLPAALCLLLARWISRDD